MGETATGGRLARRLATAPPAKHPGPECSIAALLDRLDPEDRAALVDHLDRRKGDPGWRTSRQLHIDLVDEGFELSYWQLSYHRSRGCSCWKGQRVARGDQ